MLARLGKSGLTQAEFCKREGLNPSNLAWWKREISKRDNAVGRGKGSGEGSNKKDIYWREIIARFKTSGLSKDDFCAREHIKPQAFVWWRGELSRRDNEKPENVVRQVEPKSNVFIPLSLVEPPAVKPRVKEPRAIAEVDIFTGTVYVFDTASFDALVTFLKALREVGS